MNAFVLEQVRRRRTLIRTVLRRSLPRRRRLPRQQEPKAIAIAYYGQIVSILELARAVLHRRLIVRLAAIVAGAGAARDSLRADDKPKDVNKILDEVSDEFYEGLGEADLDDLAATYAIRTSAFHRRELSKQLQAAMGVEVPFQDKGMRDRIEAFTAENVSLIKSIPQRFFDQVEQRVIAGVREGMRAEQLAEVIEARFEVSKKSAQLIARDQVGKFYGELQKARQSELGIAGYIWRTVNDNRVREEHAERDGTLFRWDDPPEDGHPGIPVNCRCYAEPDLSAILAAL